MRTPVTFAVGLLAVLTATLAFGALSKDDVKHLNKAAAVLSEFRNSSDIPESMWSKAHCVLVIPSLKKGAFIVGGEFGSGVMSCRQSNRAWGTPIFMQLTKGSAGFQAGVQSKTPEGAQKIPNGVLHELKRLYFDTAQSANPYAMGPLTRLVSNAQICFGTDFPYRPIADNVSGLAECGLFGAPELEQVERTNASRLFPRLA